MTNGIWRLFVAGIPATKGSTRSFAHRSTGRIVTLPDNPLLRTWEGVVATRLLEARVAPVDRPVEVSLTFRLPRPKGQRRSSGEPRRSAPRFPARKPDLDKLARAVLDAMTGVAYHDDAQVVGLSCRKVWCRGDEAAGVEIACGDPAAG